MGPVRELSPEELINLKDKNSIRNLNVKDFQGAIKNIPASVSKSTIKEFDDWRKEKGAA